jgi:hypothetical protein
VKVTTVGPVGKWSQAQWLNALPPVNASARTLRHTPHDSGSRSIRYVLNVGLLHPLLLAGLPGALFFIRPCLVFIIVLS